MTDQFPLPLKQQASSSAGCEWFGAIPQNWTQLPFCAIAKIKSIANQKNEDLLSVYLELGVVKFDDIDEKRTNATSADLSSYQLVEAGDFVLNNQQAWRGSVGVSKFRGIVSPAYLVFELDKRLDSRFANYLFRDCSMVSQYLISSKGVGTIQRNLYWAHLKRAVVYLPPISVQVAIADFLDGRTVQIDQAIQIKVRQIERLKERQQILIQQTVTRGLDVHAPMRDSGVDWIGDVPAHWELKKMRYLGTTQNGISAGADFFGHGHPFVSYGDVYNNEQLPESVSGLANASVAERSQYSIERGDVLFTRTSETAEEIGFASTCFKAITNATFAGFLIRFRPKINFLFEGYSKYYFNAPMLRAYFVKEMSIVTRASLSQQLLKNMLVLLPPAGEQREIYDFLERESAKFKKSIEIQTQQIKNLKEYKATLVNSAVTGKITVPGIVEPQVEDMELA